MRLLCEAGWHSPDGLPTWNAGYYFARCRRCGQELVRPTHGKWQVPKGFRIVWQSEPPENYRSAELVPEPGYAEAGAQAQTRPQGQDDPPSVPAEPVVDPDAPSEQAEEQGAAEGPSPPAAEEPAPETPRFEAMNDQDRKSWEAIMGVPAAAAARHDQIPRSLLGGPEGARDAAQGESRSGAFFQQLKRRFASGSAGDLAGDGGLTGDGGEEGQKGFFPWGTIAMVALLALLAAAAALFGDWASRPPAQPRAIPAAPAPPPAMAAPGRITASLVNCRLAPSQDAHTLLRLPRGDRVTVSEISEGWASISYDGQQCWVLAEYIAID